MPRKPSFNNAWHAFMEVRLSVAGVGQKIGVKVQHNIDLPEGTPGRFKNACPIRMSYVLNKTGFPIAKSSKYHMVSGGDGKQYIYRVHDMMQYLEHTFGKPDKTVQLPKNSDFMNMKGIIVVKGRGWGDAAGHVTLWNGIACSDQCHLMYDPDNGTFTPGSASIWVLN